MVSEQIFLPLEEDDGMNDNIYDVTDDDNYTPESLDEYLSAQVMLPIGESYQKREVIRRKRDHNRWPVGVWNDNPILDTREYDVIFPDGTIQSYLANTIAENIYSQIDNEGHYFSILSEIIDHKRNDATDTEGACHTTKGWELLVSWKDGTTTYVPLRDMKNSYPVETADYAINNNIAKEPAFSWWVPHVQRKREHIIGKLKKKKYWSKTHKYGIELPKSVKEALAIDRRMATTFWHDAIHKEMKNVLPAFRFNDDDKVPIGYKNISCHMIFDVKMIGLVQKA